MQEAEIKSKLERTVLNAKKFQIFNEKRKFSEFKKMIFLDKTNLLC
jgi:hypothetical protein